MLKATTELQERILSRVTTEDRGHDTPCWVSDRAKTTRGPYTKIGVSGRTLLTHRAAYEAWVGPIPDGLQLDHLCRVTLCCNPDHLEPVTCRENLLRGDTLTAAEAAQTHCRNGHEFTPTNTYVRPDRAGRTRGCRTCRTEQAREAHRRAAARKQPATRMSRVR